MSHFRMHIVNTPEQIISLIQMVDHPNLFVLLDTYDAINFDGYLVLETYNTALGDFAYWRGIFQNICPDAQAFVRRGVFLTDLLIRNAK